MTAVQTQESFEEYRPLLFAIAYRMTGSASESEDLVQDAYLRYLTAPPAEVRSLKALLTTIITRLCLDHLKSARVQRESYVGPWLPEPVLTDEAANQPLHTLTERETLSSAFLVLLQTLTPPERAVFLLHDIFEYPYDEIVAIVAKPAATCRQLLHRARERVAARRPRFEPSHDAQQRLLAGFLSASLQGNVERLASLLAQDVVSWSDGGGKVAAALNPIRGRDAVGRFIVGVIRKAPPSAHPTVREINGSLGLLLWAGSTLISAVTFEEANGEIVGIRWVLNPDKLAFVERQLRLAEDDGPRDRP